MNGWCKMKLVSIKPELLALYEQDAEVLRKAGRPYVAVVKLRYRGCVCDFAVPIRSNIPAAAPKEQYFALPPRPTTRPFNRHGLHYIKMFPVDRRYFERYRTEGNAFAELGDLVGLRIAAAAQRNPKLKSRFVAKRVI